MLPQVTTSGIDLATRILSFVSALIGFLAILKKAVQVHLQNNLKTPYGCKDSY